MLALIKNPQIYECSKHINIAHHHVRDLEKRGRIKVNYISTEDMAADGLTKPLVSLIFDRHVDLLELCKV